MHKNEQIMTYVKCDMNYGIDGNASSKTITSYKNIFGSKSILKFIQRYARYRNTALI